MERRQIPPSYGVEGETGYTVPLIVTTWGEKDDMGLVFPFLHSKTLIGFICSFVLGHHNTYEYLGTLEFLQSRYNPWDRRGRPEDDKI